MRIFVWALALALFAGGCGKKADPRAPELAAPERITNLRAQSAADGISLSWNRPSQYVDGRELKDLASFVIFRKDLPQNCLDCPVPYRQLTTVSVEDRDKFAKQRQYRFVDANVQPKSVYRYRVTSQLTDGTLGEPSNEIEIVRGP
ncbi:MAG: hypothetical protein FJ145_12770 [Deltaproteobacteria bacterium]|nr:hypothetical protein [Deltaproteobacteria bacterium]